MAEVPYTAVTSKKGQAITARLIVRRVKDLNRKAACGQDELFPVWRHHARHGRGEITLHLPEGWYRQTEWMNRFEVVVPRAHHPV